MDKKTSSRSFDSIRPRTKKTAPVKRIDKKKKSTKINWTAIIFLILVPIFVAFSLFCINSVFVRIKAFKMFQNGRYLVLFQNNAEIRPSGGFIGSFAVVEFANFKVKKIDFNSNINKLDKAYTADHTVPPPAPLSEIAGGRWAMRDANFAVSFPESARKVEWFYNQESGESVDGVIAVNASLLRDLLKITGPIQLEEPAVTVTADNFFTELTNQIENEYFSSQQNQQTNEPKEILKTMMPEVFKRVSSLNKFKMISFIFSSLSSKEIQFFANDPAIEQSILDLNYGGQVREAAKDYLQVNVANIGGSKSSQNIKEDIVYKIDNLGGVLTGDLTISRSHTGTGVWPDGVNRSWLRILVPKGSVLKSADLDGNDITAKVESGEEAGKTYFASWVIVKPQETGVLHLAYSLPVTPQNYELLLQKQSGNSGDVTRVLFDGKLLFNGVLNRDIVVSQD